MASVNKVKQIIKTARKAEVAVWIWGQHGNGKSQIVKQVADDLGIGFMDIRAAYTEAGDWMGLPYLNPNSPDEMKFAKSQILPTEGEGILFLDELNRARPDILQCVFQLVLDKRIGTHYKMPQGWTVVVASNPADADYQVTDIDPALLGRFCHLQLTPTSQEWLDFAKVAHVQDEVRQFIGDNKKMLGNAVEGVKLEHVQPNPRSWELLSSMIKCMKDDECLDECLPDVATGLVGSTAAIELRNYMKSRFKRLNVEEILNDYGNVRPQVKKMSTGNVRADVLKEAIDDLFEPAFFNAKEVAENETQLNNVFAFLNDIPSDIAFTAFLKIAENYDPIMDKLIKSEDKTIQKFYEKMMKLNADQ